MEKVIVFSSCFRCKLWKYDFVRFQNTFANWPPAHPQLSVQVEKAI